MKRKTVAWVLLGVLALPAAYIALGYGYRLVSPEARRKGKITKSIDNLRTLLLYDVGAGVRVEKHVPRYGGKRWFLRLVATNLLSRSDPKQLELLFSPGDPLRSLEKAGGPKAYERVTLAALDDPAFDPSALTSYVGPRLDVKARVPPTTASPDGDPIVADLSIPGGVILGFPGGKVRWFDAEELGLPPDQPIFVGDASPNEMLQHLSDR
jgi:hypothetical protein